MNKDGTNEISFEINNEQLSWFLDLSVKIVVGVKSEDDLLNIYNMTRDASIPCVLIKDKGFTEFNGLETYNAVGIGPWDRYVIDQITGHLPLM